MGQGVIQKYWTLNISTQEKKKINMRLSRETQVGYTMGGYECERVRVWERDTHIKQQERQFKPWIIAINLRRKATRFQYNIT